MNSKYTPGPWAVSRDAVPEGHVQTTIYAEASGERVATAFLVEENASLIAAAPDLLVALERTLARLNHYTADIESCDLPSGDDLTIEQARAAIALARGK